MARLIEIQDVTACPSPLTVQAGDVLLLHAAGARLQSGADAVDLLGSFTPALLAGHGQVLAAEGAPNTVLIRARQPGGAAIAVISGDPFHAPVTTAIRITVQG